MQIIFNLYKPSFLLFFCFNIGYAQYLRVPKMVDEKPRSGFRVKLTTKEYEGTDVYYSLYLPENYKKGRKYPVIVEYTGNKWSPGASTGEVKDANLGYAIARKLNAIWIVLPYIENKTSITTWWGSEEETIDFALQTIRQVCENYGGNPAEIFLCGFSRGAIGVNYLGLYNNKIADVWLGFFTHDHYDGVKEWKGTKWGSPLEKYREDAKTRFIRINGRSCLISQSVYTIPETSVTKNYLEENKLNTIAKVAYIFVPISTIIPKIPSEHVPHRHTDKWLLYHSKYADNVYEWFLETIKEKPGTYSVSGTVKDAKGEPICNALVESGNTHFTFTNKNGTYFLEGLISGNREVSVAHKKNSSIIESKVICLKSDVDKLDFVIRK